MVVLINVAESWIKPPAEPLEFFQEWFQRRGGAG